MFRFILFFLYAFSLFASDSPKDSMEDSALLCEKSDTDEEIIVKGATAIPDEPENVVSSLLDYIGTPIPKMHDSIAIISGSWVQSEMYLTDSVSIDPYQIGYFNSSNNTHSGTIATAWDIMHPKEIVLYDPPLKVKYRNRKTPSKLRAIPLISFESGASSLSFSSKNRNAPFKPKLDESGFCHFSSIHSPQPSTPYTTTFNWDRKKGSIQMEFADGTKRIYERHNQKIVNYTMAVTIDMEERVKRFKLTSILFPSGIQRVFHYQGTRVSSIETKTDSGTVIGRVSFNKWYDSSLQKLNKKEKKKLKKTKKKLKRFPKENGRRAKEKEKVEKKEKKNREKHPNREDVVISDGRALKIKYWWSGNYSKIDSFALPGGQEISFVYNDNSMIYKKRESGGKSTEATFYESKKISSLLATRFQGQTTPELIYRLEYKEPKKNISETSIADADGYTTEYQWDKKTKRIIWVHKKDSSGKRLSSERYIWNKKGFLIRRVIFDDAFMPILMKEWNYQKYNVVSEKSYGYFTDGAAFNTPLKLKRNSYEWISGGEILEEKASYDEWHRKTSETNPAGFRWEYRYQFQERRPHLAAVYCITPEGAVCKRKFYKYGEGDLSYSCVEEIEDDGSSYDASCMEDVVVRTIIRKKIWTKMPAWGAIAEQEELVWTQSFGEKVTKRVVYHRDSDSGLLLEEQAFGNDGKIYARTSFIYDHLRRCTETTLSDGSKILVSYNPTTGFVDSKTTSLGTEYYTYNHNGQVIAKKMVYPDGSDLSSHMQTDASGRVTTEIDDRGREKKTARDILGRIIETSGPKLFANGSIQIPVVTYSYNGMIVEKRLPDSAKEKILFSSHGKPLTIISATGAITTYRYDLLGREIEKRDQSGYTLRKEYNEYGHIIRFSESFDGKTVDRIRQVYKRSRLELEQTIGTITTYTYDDFGRLAQTKSRDRVTDKEMSAHYSYDTQHRLIRTSYPESGLQEVAQYDCMNRLLEKATENMKGEIVSRKQTIYDSLGRVTEERALIEYMPEKWASTHYEYGAYNTVSKITLPDGNISLKELNIAELAKDGLSYYVERNINPDGTVIETWKNSFDIAIKTITYNSLYHVIQKKIVNVDIMGRATITCETPINPITAENCGDPVRCAFSYDSQGNLIQEIRGIGSDNPYKIGFRFDSLGRKIEEIKPSGVKLFYTYDGKGRLLSQKSSDGTVHYQFTYNDLDLPIQAKDFIHNESVYRSYSGREAITAEVFSDSLTIEYKYDGMGRCIRTTSSLFGDIDYSYENGLLKTVLYKEEEITYGKRSPLGAAHSYTIGNMEVCSTYDDSFRRNSVKAYVSDKSSSNRKQIFSEERLEFSLQGSVTQTRFVLPHESSSRNEVYQYDPLGQIQSDFRHTYTFDSLNRSIMLRGTKRSFNELHQLQNTEREYDCDGRVITDKDGIKYIYDALDRLAIIKKGNSSVEYWYDAFHRRVGRLEKKNGEVYSSERYIFQQENEIGSYNSKKDLLSFRVIGEGLGAEIGGTLFIIDEAQKVHYTVSDISGHIRALWDSVDNSISDWIDYTAFSVADRSEEKVSPWSFSSKREEPFVGLIFFGRRFYDPEEASWLTMDPLGLSDGPNFYAYVHNNPYMRFDLYGLRDEFGPTHENDMRHGMMQAVERAFQEGSWQIHRERKELEKIINEIMSSKIETSSSNEGRVSCSEPIHVKTSEILPRSYNKDAVVAIFRDSNIKSISDVTKKYRDLSLGKKLLALINGINTTFDEAVERCHIVFTKVPDIDCIVIAYNATRGVIKDLGEAGLQALRIPTEVVKTLHDELSYFLNTCLAHNIELHIEVHAHSQGALIYRRIIDYKNADITRLVEKVYTYGGAVSIKDATNFVAIGDPVPFCNIFNFLKQLMCGFRDIKFTPFRFQSPLRAHGFDNESYTEAFFSVI